MALLFHTTCYRSRWRRFVRWLDYDEAIPRFLPDPRAAEGDVRLHCQSLRCESCGERIHLEMGPVAPEEGWLGSISSDSVAHEAARMKLALLRIRDVSEERTVSSERIRELAEQGLQGDLRAPGRTRRGNGP